MAPQADLKKLAKLPEGELAKKLLARKRDYLDVLRFERTLKKTERVKFLRAAVQLPYSKAAKGKDGKPIPDDRWYVLTFANELGAYLIEDMHDPAAAVVALEPWARYAKEYPYLARNLSAAHAQLGNHEQALAFLQVLADARFDYMDSTEHDPALRSLWKLPRFKAIFKRWNATGESAAPYDVNFRSLQRAFPKQFPMPPLLLAFARKLRRLRRGSLGYFDVEGNDMPYFKGELGAHFVEFIHLGEGSAIAFWRPGAAWPKHPPIVLLGSEGEHELVAHSLEEFLHRLAKKRTNVGDFDDDDVYIASQREELKSWLVRSKSKAPAKTKLPSVVKWIAARERAAG